MTVTILPECERLRVLIADDCADAANSLALLVKFWGHDVWAAYSGDEALEMAFAHQPDVLLLDVAMPRVDGFCVARAIRRQPRFGGALLVAITGYADDSHREAGKSAGFDHYFTKPLELSVLAALLRQAAGVKKATPTAIVAEAGQRAADARCQGW